MVLSMYHEAAYHNESLRVKPHLALAKLDRRVLAGMNDRAPENILYVYILSRNIMIENMPLALPDRLQKG
jgi:hypothetical protein